jgi:hypothetical protein
MNAPRNALNHNCLCFASFIGHIFFLKTSNGIEFILVDCWFNMMIIIIIIISLFVPELVQLW